MDIPKLSNSNYEEILKETYNVSEDILKDVFRDIFSYMPYKNEIICDFILDLCAVRDIKEDIKCLLSDLLHSDDLYVLISAAVYSKKLGFNLNFGEFKVSPIDNKKNFQNISIQMSEVDKIKVLEFLERIKQFIFEYEKIKFGDEEFFIYFFCISIIKNFQFSVKECVNELKNTAEDQIIISSITFLSDKEDTVYLTSILLKIITLDNYESVLNGFPYMDKTFRDFFIAMIHETYLIKRRNELKGNEEEMSRKTRVDLVLPFYKDEDSITIKEFIDDETVDTLLKFVNVDNLLILLPEYKEKMVMPIIKPLSRDNFTISQDKEKFFTEFCLLGSPSVSHFLSYLEIYKDEFRLSEGDQRLFLDVFSRIFNNKKSFIRIVLEKMVMFRIINKDLV